MRFCRKLNGKNVLFFSDSIFLLRKTRQLHPSHLQTENKTIQEARKRGENRNGQKPRHKSKRCGFIMLWNELRWLSPEKKQQLQTCSSHFDWFSVGVLRLNSQQKKHHPVQSSWWFIHQNQEGGACSADRHKMTTWSGEFGACRWGSVCKMNKAFYII